MSRLIVNQIQGDAVSKQTEIPTGYKLVAADTGSIVAPGQIVQMKRVVVNTVTSTTSSTFINHMSAQFDSTPTVGSLVIVSGTVTAYRNPAANWASSCAIWIGSEGMSSGGSDFAPVGATSSYAGYNNYGRQGMVGDNLGNQITTTGHKTITSSHVSGGNPTFYFKVAELGGQTSYWGSAGAYTSQAYATDLTSMILYEVAQ